MDINKYTPDLAKYLPPILKQVEDFQAVSTSENPEFSLVWEAVKNTLKDQFLDDLSIVGIERWENILKLDGEGSLSDRRLHIKSKVNQDGMYTFEKLKETLATLCGGEDEYTCELKAEEYTLSVRLKLTSTNKFESVRELLNKVTPANLIIDLSLLYNKFKNFTTYTHAQLATSTHYDMRNSSQFMSD